MTARDATATRHAPQAAEYRYVLGTPEFTDLRRMFRSFTFPLTIAGIVWFLGFVIAAMFAPDFMAIRVAGNVNLGIVFGVLQFVTTFLITWLYVSFANGKLEPKQEAIREAMESGAIARRLAEGEGADR